MDSYENATGKPLEVAYVDETGAEAVLVVGKGAVIYTDSPDGPAAEAIAASNLTEV